MRGRQLQGFCLRKSYPIGDCLVDSVGVVQAVYRHLPPSLKGGKNMKSPQYGIDSHLTGFTINLVKFERRDLS